MTAFKNLRKAGIRALTIQEGDDLIGAAITNGTNEILLATKKGMACRFSETDIRPMGRTARGVTGIRFKIDGDEVVSMEVVPPLEDIESDEEAIEVGGPEVLVVTNGGMGKRSFVANYRKTRRGAKGVVNIKLNDGESVVGTLQVAAEDELIITTTSGQIVRIPIDEVRIVGRASKGVRIMRLKGKDLITGIAKVVEVDVKNEKSTDEDGENQSTEEQSDDVVSTENQVVNEETASEE